MESSNLPSSSIPRRPFTKETSSSSQQMDDRPRWNNSKVDGSKIFNYIPFRKPTRSNVTKTNQMSRCHPNNQAAGFDSIPSVSQPAASRLPSEMRPIFVYMDDKPAWNSSKRPQLPAKNSIRKPMTLNRPVQMIQIGPSTYQGAPIRPIMYIPQVRPSSRRQLGRFLTSPASDTTDLNNNNSAGRYLDTQAKKPAEIPLNRR